PAALPAKPRDALRRRVPVSQVVCEPRLPERVAAGRCAPPQGRAAAGIFVQPGRVKRLLQASAKAPGILAYRDRAMVVTLLGTGARASELLAMSVACARCKGSCIDWARNELVLH